MDLFDFLALGAGILNAAAFLKYNWEVFFGDTRPTAASWFLWSLLTIINVVSYWKMGVNWAALTVLISDTFFCTATFLFLFIVGHFGKLKEDDWTIVILSVVAIAVGKGFSPKYGNMIIQIPMILSFLPTMRDIKNRKTIEDPKVWLGFTISFFVSFLIVCIKWSGQLEDFVYPLVAITMHALTTFYAYRGRKLYSRTSK